MYNMFDPIRNLTLKKSNIIESIAIPTRNTNNKKEFLIWTILKTLYMKAERKVIWVPILENYTFGHHYITKCI